MELVLQTAFVWAHRGGIADKRLVEECQKYFPYKPGDSVEIVRFAFERYVFAINVCGTVIINRYRATWDLPRIQWPCEPDTHASYEQTHIELDGVPIERQ